MTLPTPAEHDLPFVSPDGALVIPRPYYLTAVAMVKWDLAAPEGVPHLMDEEATEKAQELIATCERFGMAQATYREIDHWLKLFCRIERESEREP